MLARLMGSRLRAKALGCLFSHPDQRFFVRQLQVLLNEDSTNLSRELARLAALGILTSQTEGKQKYFQARRSCPIFAELRGIIAKTIGAGDVLRDALKPLARRIRIAFIYGSVARGQEDRGSDVDLLVVGEVTFGEIVAALGPAQQSLGREVNPSVYPVAEWRRKLSEGHHFLGSLLGETKLFVIGDEHELTGLAEERLAHAAPKQPKRNRRPVRRRRP